MKYIKTFENFSEYIFKKDDKVEIKTIGSPYAGKKGLITNIDGDVIYVDIENEKSIKFSKNDLILLK